MTNSRTPYICLALLFVASFLLFNWPYGYVVTFQAETNDCFFLFGREFFFGFLDHPGGLVRYAGRFLGQFYEFRWIGALVLSAGISGFGLLFHAILQKCGKNVPLWHLLLPCALLLALHTSPSCVLHDTLGICVSCAALLGYLALPGQVPKRVYALAVTPIVYLAAGAYVGLLVVWVTALEWIGGPRRSGSLYAAVYALYCAALPLAAWRWLFLLPLRSTLVCPIMFGPPFRTGWADQSSTHVVVDCLLAIALCGTLLLLPLADSVRAGRAKDSTKLARLGGRKRLALGLSLVTIAVLVHLLRFDGALATVVSCRQFYRAGQWDAVLEMAGENPYRDHRVQFMTNAALYHKGTLLDEMFRYPQPWGTRGLFMNYSGMRVANLEEDDTANGMYNSDLLFEMGHVNFAFRHAYNCLSVQGRTYENLTRMAECSIVNGNMGMAKKYLNVLDRTLFHRDVVKRYREILADPDAIQREFGPIRERLPAVDGFGHPTRLFLVLLESKPDNRTALEYLMAWLLLEKTADSVESVYMDMGHLRDVGHTALPRYCQEAVLLRAQMTGLPVDPQGFVFDRALVTRAQQFLRDMSGQGTWLDEPTARSLYGDTYMYYWFFENVPEEAAPVADAGRRFSATTREE